MNRFQSAAPHTGPKQGDLLKSAFFSAAADYWHKIQNVRHGASSRDAESAAARHGNVFYVAIENLWNRGKIDSNHIFEAASLRSIRDNADLRKQFHLLLIDAAGQEAYDGKYVSTKVLNELVRGIVFSNADYNLKLREAALHVALVGLRYYYCPSPEAGADEPFTYITRGLQGFAVKQRPEAAPLMALAAVHTIPSDRYSAELFDAFCSIACNWCRDEVRAQAWEGVATLAKQGAKFLRYRETFHLQHALAVLLSYAAAERSLPVLCAIGNSVVEVAEQEVRECLRPLRLERKNPLLSIRPATTYKHALRKVEKHLKKLPEASREDWLKKQEIRCLLFRAEHSLHILDSLVAIARITKLLPLSSRWRDRVEAVLKFLFA
jgi:hypothetical protein